ncbi:MAG: potassium channel family protein [Candidatus Helarchaeota archaeon]
MPYNYFRKLYELLQKLSTTLFGKIILLTVIFILIGMFGLYFVEYPKYTLIESLYWTIITITTIGFGDITPDTMAGQFLAIILAFFGVALGTLTFAMIMEFILDTRFFQRRRFLKMVQKMDEVILICGFNERIRISIQELNKDAIKIVLVNNEPVPDDWDTHWGAYIQGNPTDDQTLLKAGVQKATKALISLDDDGDTLLTVLTIQALNNDCYIIAEVKNKANIKHFKRVNCNQIICQEEILGKFMNITLILPQLYPAYNELISMEGNEIYYLKQVSDYLNKTFEETMHLIKEKYDALLIGFVRQDKTILNPTFSEKIQENDMLLVISETYIE